MYKYCLALLLIQLTLGAPASPYRGERKCMPAQWEASAFAKLAQSPQGQFQILDIAGWTAVDYKSNSLVMFENVYSYDKLVANYTYLNLESSSYLIDRMKKKCYKMPPVPLEQHCTDSSSLSYIGSWTIGNQMTDTYKVEGKGAITVLRDSFTMVSEVLEQGFAGIPQMMAFQFGNMSLSISDPSVFDVPSYCSNLNI